MNVDLAGTLKALRTERAQLQKNLTKLDKAITVLRGLSASPNGRPKRTMSASARRKIAKAQKLRWVKARQAKAAKI